MTRRERMERRVEKRQEWAAGRDRKAAQGFAKAHAIADNIPLGQPILVGHHSEGHHRRDIARIDSGMRQGVESGKMADLHRSKAGGIQDQLDSSIYSDDPDAVEALEAKAAAIEAECEHMKAVNAAFRKARHTVDGPDPYARTLHALTEAGTITHDEAISIAKLWTVCPYHSGTPFPSYSITNRRANARRCRERIKTVQARQVQTAKAEAAPGGVLIEARGGDQTRVTFPDYPGREAVKALKAAGFHWSSPCWYGPSAALPACVLEIGGAA